MYENVIKQTCHLTWLMDSSGTMWCKNEYIKKA